MQEKSAISDFVLFYFTCTNIKEGHTHRVRNVTMNDKVNVSNVALSILQNFMLRNHV